MTETKKEIKLKAKDVPYIEAIGRRKTSVARVRIKIASQPSLLINNRKLENYFPTEELQSIVKNPLSLSKEADRYAVTVVLKGGGIHSQAEALAMGLGRVLVKSNQELRVIIKKAGLLTRDARMKERRKFGLKKARKAPQWSKR